MEIPEPVRRLAVHPFVELPRPPEIEAVDLDGAVLGINPWPGAQIVSIVGDGPSDVAAAVDAARAVARDRGKDTLAWWVAPEYDFVAPELEAAGLVNEDTPGFEAIENAMVLLAAPSGGGVEGVEVRIGETWEDFSAGSGVARQVFGLPPVSEDDLRDRYETYRRPDNPGRGFIALVDDRVVGTCYAAFSDQGVNLFGGSVLPEARGRGVYRAMLQARWDAAVERGTPALTVQAGRMSRPILERRGFEFVAPVRIFVDPLA
jgi:GNAT superfamily N-acetyltransferase